MSEIRPYLLLAGLIGLVVGVVVGGIMNEPWWYVFPISFVGGLAIAVAIRR